MKRWLFSTVFLLLLGLFLFSGYKSITLILEERHNRQLMEEAQKIYKSEAGKTISVTQGGNVIENSEYRSDFKDLKSINPDIVGWLTIEGTTIDYPILKTTDNDFYLTHNYQKETYASGSIFMDYRNRSELTDRNTILYGHSMRNQTMFGKLSNYLQSDFFHDHQSFSFDSQILSYTVTIFAVYETTTENNYIQTEFADDTEFTDYLAKAKSNSIYQTDVNPTASSHIITLSTCDQSYATNGRIVVQGILVPKPASN